MEKNKLENYLNDIKFNIVFMLIFMVCCMVISTSVEVPESANIGALLPYIYPPFLTICAIFIYLISRIFIKKNNWIVTIIGVIMNLHFVIEWHLTNS